MLVASTAFTATYVYQNTFCGVMLGGSILNALMGKLLKRIIRFDRPSSSGKRNTSYGMPSSHANSLFFYVSYLSTASYHCSLHDGWSTSLVFGALVSYALSICYYKVCVNMDHSLEQVLAGIAQGSIVGVLCYHSALPYIREVYA